MKKSSRSLSAVGLERIFIGCIVLLITLLIVSMSWLSDILRDRVTEADHAKIDAEIARDNVDQLRFLETYIEDNQKTIKRAESIVSATGQYQQQVVNDINAYAAQSGVTILGYNFVADQAASSSVQGTTVTNVTITLDNPIEYRDFLRFLKSIELGLTRMQVTGVSLTPNTDNPNQVSNPQIGLEVYLKEGQ